MAWSRGAASIMGNSRVKRALAQVLLRVVGDVAMITLRVNTRRRLILVAHLGTLIGCSGTIRGIEV